MGSHSDDGFTPPTSIERMLNRAMGLLFSLGLGLRHNYLLQVRGRKSGRLYSTPVDLLEIDGKLYLVCPRGRSQWVRNVEASGRLVLKRRGSKAFSANVIPNELKPPILKKYLDSFKTTVGRFFPLPSDSPAEAFAPYADRYPVFELIPS
ncbi:MAG TPA: nitroreductase/quinone reductase family protein [Candidatus Binataceae bacterium]|nr:nitroreductase/quinone reductase family protein [Candidatus Binataceae bacterium]